MFVSDLGANGLRFKRENNQPFDTADLAGKNLEAAMAVVSKLAGHKVLRVEDGLYRVVPTAGGEPLADRPVQEEPLPGTEVKP